MDRESIWWDEFTSVVHLQPPQEWQSSPDYNRWNQIVIRDTAPSLLGFLRQNRSMDPATMPLYYVFEYAWNKYVDARYETQRYLTVLIGMLLLPAVYALGRVLLGRNPALLVMCCAALSPLHIQFAREIRMYGLKTLLIVISVYTLVRLMRGGGRRWWAAHGVTNALLFWVHPFAVLAPFVEGLFWLCCFPRDWRRLLRWGLLMAVAVAPALIYIATIRFWDSGSTDNWMKTPNLTELAGDLFADEAVGMTYQLNATPTLWEAVVSPEKALEIIRMRWTVGRWWAAAVVFSTLVFAAAGLYRLLRGGPRGVRDGADGRWMLLPVLWFLAPPLVLYAASLVWRPCIMPRYTLHSSIGLYLILAGVVFMPRRAWLRGAAVALLVLFFGYQLSMTAGDPQHPDWRSAVARLKAEAAPDDLILGHHWLWKRVFAYNLGPVPNVVGYGGFNDILAEQCAFFTDLNLPSRADPARRRIPWVLIQTEYFTKGPIAGFERELRLRGLSFDSWEYGGIQHVMLYKVWREPGTAPPPYSAEKFEGDAAREFSDLSLEFWRANEYERAVDAARKASSINPNYSRAFSYAGMALKELDRKEEALAAFSEAVRLDFADYPWSHVNIAMLLIDLGRYAEAVDASMRALELLPNDGWAYTNLGKARLGLGQVDEALAALEKAVSLDPNDPRSRAELEKARAAKAAAPAATP